MAVEVTLESPLASAIQNTVHAKLVELGFASGDDQGLAEYVTLLLVNEKSQAEVAQELTNTVLDPSVREVNADEFARWIFEQLEILARPEGQTQPPQQPQSSDNTGAATSQQQQDAQLSNEQQQQAQAGDATQATEGADSQSNQIPTGPKSMRNQPQSGAGAGGRRPGPSKLDRPLESSMHRIKGASGVGRVGKDAPRGPRSNRHDVRAQAAAAHMNGQLQGQANMQGGMFPQITPEQQMQMMAMYEQQARMMASILSPAQQAEMFGGAMGPLGPGMPGSQPGLGGGQNQGKSLFDRIDKPSRQRRGGNNKPRNQHNTEPEQADMDTAMDESGGLAAGVTLDSALTPSRGPIDAANTLCRYDTFCTKPDCPFAHHSPVGTSNTPLDMNDICAYGAACKNRKCIAKHPSPAKKNAHQAAQPCKFFPNCTNPHCPFQHPDAPPCRNGADCTVPDCKFFHSAVECKFDPCMNPSCPYKHREGQKRGKFEDRVWVKPGEQGHVSERKFVNETGEGEEELVIPGATDEESSPVAGEGGNDAGQHAAQSVTA